MIVNLIKKQQMFSSKLPTKVKGQYWIKDIDEEGKSRELIGIEAIDGTWVIKSNHLISIIGENNEMLENVSLKENIFLNLRFHGSDERIILVTHAVEDNRQIFEKYLVKDGSSLEIGRSEKNQIIHSNKYISSHHAKIEFHDGKWGLEDLNSTNGTYVNGKRAQKTELKIGDLIYIMGLEIIIGKQFIAINNPDEGLKLNTSNLAPFRNQKLSDCEIEDEKKDYFYRSPRFRREIEPLNIKIDAPPQREKLDTVPMSLMLGPAVTMGMASMGTGAISVVNTLNNNGSMMTVMPTVIMSGSMLLGTVLWPILTKKHEKKEKIAYEKMRQEKYFQYLNEVKDQIKRACIEQKSILEENFVSSQDCVDRIIHRERNLWERMPIHDDFLKLRIGIGELPLQADIKYQERKFDLQEDNLQDAMFMLGKENKMLENVPIVVSLKQDNKLGIVGEREDAIALMKSLLLQTITLHSYDEVKIVLLVNEAEQQEWEEFFYTFHIWNKDKSIRFLATNADDMKALSAYMEKELLPRIESDTQTEDMQLPYYLIVAADKQLADKSEILQKLMENKENAGYSIVMLYDELQNLPKETSNVVEVHKSDGKIYDKNDISGNILEFTPEFLKEEELEKATVTLANIELDLSDENYTMPNALTFLEMFGVGRVSYLNPLQRWKENNPAITLQTPVGVDANGELSYLDLHEKYHGPHGLVAGMTGSGKSEFIITYILSLAVNYHPDEVAFILIDYKGGGLAGAFEDEERGIKLPHLAGTITNLDGAAVKRSLISIQSELRRRQAIFNEARKIANEGTMDIYKYQTLYRNHIVSEPIPHLFIISDEFAELKTQQPEFMEQLISAARIGRSLGVHLILATQKPAGVVDDQIWSNSKFRVCLKVQDKADSIDMIKRPDAAELSQTGRFYLQVGFNEYFAMGQSAWCGADYMPTDQVEKKVDRSICMVDHLGRVVKEIKPQKQIANNGEKKIKQVVAIVKYLSDLAEEEHISVRPLWLPAIPAQIFIADLYEKYGIKENHGELNPVIGEYDDPFNQKQFVLRVDFSEKGNCLVYGAAGAGKATFITSMIYSMLLHQKTEYLNLYLLDFGSETLKIFEKAPQVGGVLLSHEEEKIRNLIKMLYEEMDNRKRLFSDYGGDIQSYLKNTNEIVPNILVVINNYTGLNEAYEDLEEKLIYLFRDGIKYGIYFCVTVNGTNGIRYRASQNFAQIFTLQQNDPSDYPVIVGNTEGVLPAKIKGRGLVRFDKVYEFQTAYCFEEEQQECLRKFCLELAGTTKVRAREIPILPEVVDAEVMQRYIENLNQVPVGVGKERLDVQKVSLLKEYIYMITSQERELAVKTAIGIGKVCSYITGLSVEIWDVEKTIGENDWQNVKIWNDKFESAVSIIFNELVMRNNLYKEADMDLSVLEPFEQKVIVICGLDKLFSTLSDDGKDKLRVFLEKGQSEYKIHFIIADEVRQLSAYTAEGWYRQNVNAGNGIWIGDGFADQYFIKISKHSSSLYQEIGDQFGYLVNRGKPTLVKVITMSDMEE